ncbi:MAG: M20/M25/M40 family metallo-hydrolase [Gemmatimonadetes bacterium]|nr:M20/M25/M40 family metallo-hydrolase [Gemmatimonadota bacterium]
MYRVLIVGLLSAASAAPLTAQQNRLDQTLERGQQMWNRGDYAGALGAYLRVMRGGQADSVLQRVALATGELYVVEEIAVDGRSVRFSADGRFAAYETGSGASTVTHIVPMDREPGGIAEFPGRNFVFSPSGDFGVYLTVEESDELRRVRADAERLMAQRDRRGAFARRRDAALIEARLARLAIRDLQSETEHRVSLDGLLKLELSFGADGQALYLIGGARDDTDPSAPPAIDVYVFDAQAETAKRLTTDGRPKSGLVALANSGALLFSEGNNQITLYDISSAVSRSYEGNSPAHAASAPAFAFLSRDGDVTAVKVASASAGWNPVTVVRSDRPLRAPAMSPNGQSVTFQIMPEDNWEVAVVGADGTGERLLSSEIQHDRFPRFISNDLVLAAKGEGRHQRSYLYEINTGEEIKLFHNNTVRTIAPEYEWASSADATKVLVVAERDGDTVSPERGVYLVHLDRTVTHENVVQRLESSLAAERDLRARGAAMFAPIQGEIRSLTEFVSGARLYEYQAALFAFGSKFITQPGNGMAAEYIHDMLVSFGYEPEYQWFEPRPGIRSANVIATLRGTEDPDLVYVVSSHFDSVERGPGADDNTSGTSVLLETARRFAGHPMPATIKFAFFTGEEAGLLGSREFVRRAVRDGEHIVGALNNDMLGWANNGRLDNTIRYSNEGIRDVQHAAAFLFSGLITYDAKYYKSTDAHAYYEEYGDIVGGIGSYPVLGNPHYHQATDELATINQDLIRETTKTNIASIALLAASPSRLTGLRVHQERGGGGTVVQWNPSVESSVSSYTVAYGPVDDPMRYTVRVGEPEVMINLTDRPLVLAVRAVNQRGLASWDWARTTVPAR